MWSNRQKQQHQQKKQFLNPELPPSAQVVPSPTPTQQSLNSNATFARFTRRKEGWPGPSEEVVNYAPPPPPPAPRRFLTLVFGDMETVKILPNTFAEAEKLAREWVQIPDDVPCSLRVPVEYASIQASRLLQGPYLWLDSEDTYQLAQTTMGLRMEITADAPPPDPEMEEEEQESAAPPPPPPVLEMPASFALELAPNRTVVLDTVCATDEDFDMAHTDDGTVVDGAFWGVMKIKHDYDKDEHTVDFTGTRLTNGLTRDFFLDRRTISKLQIAVKPTSARCTLTVRAPAVSLATIEIEISNMWSWGFTYPQAEPVSDGKVKYFVRAHPDGYLEHFTSNLVITSLYYEAMPDMTKMDPASYISPQNGFAMPLQDFIPHLSKVLDELHLGIPVRTQLLSNAIGSFGHHKNIAYRFMLQDRINLAIKISLSADPAVSAPILLTRIFLMWRGVTDEEMLAFEAAGEPEAASKNWKEALGITNDASETTKWRLLETAIMECS